MKRQFKIGKDLYYMHRVAKRLLSLPIFSQRIHPTAAHEESRELSPRRVTGTLAGSTTCWYYLLLFLEVIHGRGAAEGKKVLSLSRHGEVGACATSSSSTVLGAVRAWEIFDAKQFFTLVRRRGPSRRDKAPRLWTNSPVNRKILLKVRSVLCKTTLTYLIYVYMYVCM